MKPYETFQLQILERGIIEVLKETKMSYNDQDIVLERWRTTLSPLDKDYAKEVLPEYYYNICLSVWTNDIVEAFSL